MIEAFAYARPEIPEGLFHDMYDIRRKGGFYDSNNGGQWVPGEEERLPFQGVILPVSSKDLIRENIGTYSLYNQKVYTNGYSLAVGAQVYDPMEDITYTVKQELGHNSIHPQKRYLIEAKGEAEE
ncbi:hypothetical protein [Anaerobutyricum hallii]|uniref:hypothetical protein n=1 Tax=Anaerobutyricum hallii TaxID=39488 RepID=UPI000E734957|nr:hypothetical protein [Anaerobutyricum hallii]RJW41951.1 hypothetical protein DXC97_02490 [Lachnospiraceae bacterium TF09-5]